MGGVLAKSERVAVELGPELSALIRDRLPRGVNLSMLLRWFLRSLVMDSQEIQTVCWKNQLEADAVGPFIRDSLRKLFEAMPEDKKNG